ncbi:MAG: glycosyltransferase [Deltaproteobacteria bacterium]|nr:glycosyltransferase [Deltaproteobacteria bacterium]
MNPDILVSVAVILRDNEDIVEGLLKECLGVLAANFAHFELLLLDNGSTDRTVERVRGAMTGQKNLRLLILAREYWEETAYQAALESAIGDFVVLLDPLYDPPELIPAMVEACAAGNELVVAQPRQRLPEPLLYRFLAWLFYRVFSFLSDRDIQWESSNFVCLSRKVVNSIIQVKDRVRYLKYLSAAVGCQSQVIPYDRRPRGGALRRRRAWLERFNFAMDVISAHSDKLIRSATLLAFFCSFLSLAYILYIVAVLIFKTEVAEGWSSTSLVLATLFGAVFFLLGILCQYVGLLAKETKRGSLYIILDEVDCSHLFGDIGEHNVTSE